MKIKMINLNKINVSADEIKCIKFRKKQDEKGIFILKTANQKYIANIENAFDYFYLSDYLKNICPDKLYKHHISEFITKDGDKTVKSIWTTIKIDRIAKEMNIEIIHNTIIHVLLDDYEDFGYNAMKFGNFEKNVKKAITLFDERRVSVYGR